MGSGAVVVALAKELPQMDWLALDLSAAALTVARDNARRHGVAGRIHFVQGDLRLRAQTRPQVRPAGGQSPLCAPGRMGAASQGY